MRWPTRDGHPWSVLDAVRTLPAAADAPAVLELYRVRWQFVCVFQRLKRLLPRDALRAFDPPRAQPYLLAKLLGPSWWMRSRRPTPLVSLRLPGPPGCPAPSGG